MTLGLYFDVNVPGAIVAGLRRRGIDVVTAQDDGRRLELDPALLDRSAALRRVLVTCDNDFLAEARRRQASGLGFAGVIFIHQCNIAIGRCVHDLEYIARAGEADDLRDRVLHVPL